MIEEAYCNFEVSKLLNEKGFRIDTEKDYWKIGADGTMYFISAIGAYTSDPDNKYAFYIPEDSYPCPTQQMAMRWLREEHNIVISISNGNHKKDNGDRTTPDYPYFFFTITDSYACYDEKKQCFDEFNTYEEAVEAAVRYVLENLL